MLTLFLLALKTIMCISLSIWATYFSFKDPIPCIVLCVTQITPSTPSGREQLITWEQFDGKTIQDCFTGSEDNPRPLFFLLSTPSGTTTLQDPAISYSTIPDTLQIALICTDRQQTKDYDSLEVCSQNVAKWLTHTNH